MTCSIKYAPQLRAQGLRMTPQRAAILHVLHHSGRHLSPTQVYDLARKEFPSLTEPTVYRTLEYLAEKKFVLAAHVGNGKMVYELTENNNHHHLICRHCGKTIEVDHAPLERLYHQLESSTGYKLDSSHVTFFGLCPNCQS
ncbi:MAG: Fur family transcriptional regulator [Anaerolineales bacterium]|nr:Fur family transcriptional regulator [Anaerolineales bacterium]